VRKGIFGRTTGYVYAVDGRQLHSRPWRDAWPRRGVRLRQVDGRQDRPQAGRADGGEIVLDGIKITDASQAEMHPHRRKMQVVFQDPYSSLNPRMTAGEIVGERSSTTASPPGRSARTRSVPVRASRPQARTHAQIPARVLGRQRQRLGIARALAVGQS